MRALPTMNKNKEEIPTRHEEEMILFHHHSSPAMTFVDGIAAENQSAVRDVVRYSTPRNQSINDTSLEQESHHDHRGGVRNQPTNQFTLNNTTTSQRTTEFFCTIIRMTNSFKNLRIPFHSLQGYQTVSG